MEKYLEKLKSSKMIKSYDKPPQELLVYLEDEPVRNIYFGGKSNFETLWSYYDGNSAHCDRMKVTKIIYREFLNYSNLDKTIKLLAGYCLVDEFVFSYDTLNTIQSMYTALLKGLGISLKVSREEKFNQLCNLISEKELQILLEYAGNIHKIGNFAIVPFYFHGKPFNTTRGSFTGKFRDLIGISLLHLKQDCRELEESIGMSFNEYINFMHLHAFCTDTVIKKEKEVLLFIKKPNDNNKLIFEYMDMMNKLIVERNCFVLDSITKNTI